MSKIVDSLRDRMETYEAVPKIKLMTRTPVVIRVGGKAFHTFTKGCENLLIENYNIVWLKQ